MKNINSTQLAAVVPLLAPCTSTFEIYNTGHDPETAENTNLLTASIETGTLTKTALGEVDEGYVLNWLYNDQIKIYSGNTAVLFETNSDYTMHATFSAVDNAYLPAADKYVAFYPVTLDKDNLTLPAKQTWVRDNISGFPMYAESSTRSLSFKDLCGVLRFRNNLKETGPFSVSSITVSSEGKGMSGFFRIVDNTAVDNNNAAVTLECTDAVSLYSSSTRDFYIYVPAGEYNPLKVTVVSSDGVEKKYESDGAVSVARSGMTSVKLGTSTSSAPDGSTEIIPVTDMNVNFFER